MSINGGRNMITGGGPKNDLSTKDKLILTAATTGVLGFFALVGYTIYRIFAY